jgi:hypothetical protein
MKILFNENRCKTWLWEKMALILAAGGHEIHWIVQNRMYTPAVGTVHFIRYPSAALKQRRLPADAELSKLMSTDRNVNFFGGNPYHYNYYYEQIAGILDQLAPAVVFGESTLFHELLCGDLCRRKGLLYLHPTVTRYPPRRFCFLLYDTLDTFAGSGDTLPDRDARVLIEAIASRAVVPDYMRPGAQAPRLTDWLVDRLRVVAGYSLGERYNTPSPWRKAVLNRQLGRNLERWDRLARSGKPRGGFAILFPLQMQPEANIDVWGNEFRDQVALLRRIAAVTDPRTAIVVKTNPKPKYEVSRELLELIEQTPRITALERSVTMGDALKDADLVVTVTGTVAIEAAFSRVPVATMVSSFFNFNPGCLHAQEPESIAHLVELIRRGEFPKNSPPDDVRFIRHLLATSYPGMIGSPVVSPACGAAENVEKLAAGLRHVLATVSAAQPAAATVPDSHAGLEQATYGQVGIQ